MGAKRKSKFLNCVAKVRNGHTMILQICYALCCVCAQKNLLVRVCFKCNIDVDSCFYDISLMQLLYSFTMLSMVLMPGDLLIFTGR